MKPIYLDYAASTPVDPRVLKVMQPYFNANFGNPGSLHAFGQEAMAAVDKSRERLAVIMGVDFEEIVFTSSASEANNLAITGAVECFKKDNPGITPHIVVSAIEHESILQLARSLALAGAELTILPVDGEGFVSAEQLKDSLKENTVIISILRGSNEIGVLEDIASLSQEVSSFRTSRKSRYPLLHTDASQSFTYEGLLPKTLGVQLATISSQKCFGPKGIALLYISKDIKDLVMPIINGGGQEFGLRSGTENVPAIVGFAAAAELAQSIAPKESKRLMELKEVFFKEIKKICKGASLNGNLKRAKSVIYKRELPHILNVHFPGFAASDLIVAMDLNGLAVSAGSACRSRSNEPSYVIDALNLGGKRASESLRFSFGRYTTKADLNNALKVIKKTLKVY